MSGKDNDLLVVTVMEPSQVKCHVQLTDLSKIIKDYLHLLEMYAPLIVLLKQKNVLEEQNDGLWGSVYAPDLLRVIQSPDFLRITPKFKNYRQTECNIKLIETGIILCIYLKLLTPEELRHGINAYTLICRETKIDLLEMNFDKVQRACRLLNKTLSMKSFTTWFQRSEALMECRKPEKIEFEQILATCEMNYFQKNSFVKTQDTGARPEKRVQWVQAKKKQQHQISLISGGGTSGGENGLTPDQVAILDRMEGKTLMPHEFLYLLCCSSDRIQQINNNHKTELRSKQHVIYQWEIQNAQKEDYVSHIHLLANNAFKNNAPHHLVNDSMHRLTADGNFRYVGGQFISKPSNAQTYSKLFKRNFERATKQQQMPGEENGHLEVELFLSQNFDNSKQNVKRMKQMSKDRSIMNKFDDEENEEANKNQVKYNPKNFLNENGQIDFSKAQVYDPDLTQSNLLHVNRHDSSLIVQPRHVKKEEVEIQTDFILTNRSANRQVSRLNLRRAQMMEDEKKDQQVSARAAKSAIKRDIVDEQMRKSKAFIFQVVHVLPPQTRAPTTPSRLGSISNLQVADSIVKVQNLLLQPQAFKDHRQSKMSQDQRSKSPQIQSPFAIQANTPGHLSTAQFKPGYFGNLVSTNEDRTSASRNGGFGVTSDKQSSRGRPISQSRNAPPALQNFLNKVGITSEGEQPQSSSRQLAHQASEANFIKTPLRMAFSGKAARPTTSKNVGKHASRNRVMSSFGR